MPSAPSSFFKRLSHSLRQAAGPAGPWLNQGWALLLAVWGAHTLLRMAVLFRNDGFGFPLVGKADWYIFHAVFIDLHWIFLGSLPILLLLIPAARLAPRLCSPLLIGLAITHAALLLATVIDHETLRFMGMHFDPGMMKTYGNSAAGSDAAKFILHDASIPGLPFALFFGVVPLAALFYALLRRKAVWTRARDWDLRPVAWVVAAGFVGYLYVYHVWTGGNRMRLLRPVVSTTYLALWKSATPPLAPDTLVALARSYQEHWRDASGDSDWVFPIAGYPYYREPLEYHCARPGVALAVCAEDTDGDGFPKSS